MVRSPQVGPAIGFVAQLALLIALAGTVGLGGLGWLVGVACGGVTALALRRGLARADASGLGPADWVTLGRAVLVGGVAALVADSFVGASHPAALLAPSIVALSIVALVLDAVDGWVARRTATASDLGARFDMEVDAFLILVLSGYVAQSLGWWVIVIGAARYAFVVAGWIAPWLRAPLPPRYWRKVVAATQGIVLTIAAAGVLARWLTILAVAVALVLLVESFGRDVWWLWHHRGDDGAAMTSAAARQASLRGVWSATVTVLAFLLVWFALTIPNDMSQLSAGAFVRIPLEGLVIVLLAVILPVSMRRPVAALIGVVLGVLTIVAILDMGFYVAFGRSFNPVFDWAYFGSAVDLLSLSVGRRDAIVTVVGAVVLALALLVFLPLAVVRLTGLVSQHRVASFRAVAVLGVVWVAFTAIGLQIVAGVPVASAGAAGLAYEHLGQVRDGVRDQQTFAEAAAVDPLRGTPDTDLLSALRGKDVIVAFVESYGRVAIEGLDESPQVRALLDAGSARLRADGFQSKSAFLTSPTFGGLSWLAHSTLQSGLRIDNQQRYDSLVSTDRMTLSDAFKRAGWRTVADVPSNEQDWSQGASFYGYDQIYDARNVGYRGPNFSYASMPDQYILSAFHRLELARPDHPPVMAEIDLVSSHTPWTPLPRMIDWVDVGDGSAFRTMVRNGPSRDILFRDPRQVKAAYATSIEYSLSSLISFVEQYGDDNLVLVILGDHQPGTIVSGPGASHDVPVTIVAHDPAVFDRIAGWGWQDGLRPDAQAPVWPMESFRDRFLTAFGRPIEDPDGATTGSR